MTEPRSDSDQPDGRGEQPRQPIPGTVQAAVILLYIGGALTLVSALSGLAVGALVRAAIYAVLGGFYLVLGRKVQHRRPWARRVVLVICAIGIALAVVHLIGSGVAAAVTALAWPVVYAILLSGRAARAWFADRMPDGGASL